jgi:hypothetical protein
MGEKLERAAPGALPDGEELQQIIRDTLFWNTSFARRYFGPRRSAAEEFAMPPRGKVDPIWTAAVDPAAPGKDTTTFFEVKYSRVYEPSVALPDDPEIREQMRRVAENIGRRIHDAMMDELFYVKPSTIDTTATLVQDAPRLLTDGYKENNP